MKEIEEVLLRIEALLRQQVAFEAFRHAEAFEEWVASQKTPADRAES